MVCKISLELEELLNALSSFENGDLKGIHQGSKMLIRFGDSLGSALNTLSSHVSGCDKCIQTYEAYLRDVMMEDFAPHEWTEENSYWLDDMYLGIYSQKKD